MRGNKPPLPVTEEQARQIAAGEYTLTAEQRRFLEDQAEPDQGPVRLTDAQAKALGKTPPEFTVAQQEFLERQTRSASGAAPDLKPPSAPRR
jgi:hypothetical protein